MNQNETPAKYVASYTVMGWTIWNNVDSHWTRKYYESKAKAEKAADRLNAKAEITRLAP